MDVDSQPGNRGFFAGKSRPIAIGVGCLAGLCLVAGLSALLLVLWDHPLSRGMEETVGISRVLPNETHLPVAATPEASPEEVTISEAEEVEPSATMPGAMTGAPAAPVIHRLVFALGTVEALEGVESRPVFFGEISEVHCVFEYSNFSPGSEWRRVWYFENEVVLDSTSPWAGEESGIFDYRLNAPEGEVFTPGVWALELYLDGQLLAYGEFEVRHEADLEAMGLGDYELLYTRFDGSRHSIWYARLDGSVDQKLLDYAASPAWSPDGSLIAFYGEEGIDLQEKVQLAPTPPGLGKTNGVWVMSAAGENPYPLHNDGTVQRVSWSPEGTFIAFDTRPAGDYVVQFLLAPGVDANTPLPFEIIGHQPAWSPSGEELAVRACRPECGIWLQNLEDGTSRLLTREGTDGLPAWSPDGTRIAFSRESEGNVDIYVVDVDGGNLQRLTEAEGADSVPAWTPDGSKIVFRSARTGMWGIWIMNADGSEQREIIPNVGASGEWAFDRMAVK